MIYLQNKKKKTLIVSNIQSFKDSGLKPYLISFLVTQAFDTV